MSKKHARYSPSKLEALELCPCFDYKEQREKKDEETAAERGRRLHKLVETGDMEFARDEDDKELLDKVNLLLDGIRLKHKEPCEEITEKEVSLGDLTYGTLDKGLLWHDIKKAVVLDWKFIWSENVSEPKDNLQLQCYVGGLLEAYPEIEEVEAYVAAPQINWLPEPCIYTRADLPRIMARVEKVTLACADPFKKPSPCDLCKQCANASRCPALGTTAVVVANHIGLPMPATFAPDSLALPEDRAKAYIIAKALTNWGEQVTKNVNEWVRQGNTLPGHTTVTKKGSMKVTDVESAVVAMRALLDDSAILGAMSMSITKITDAVAKKQGKKKDARETVENMLVGLVERAPDVVYAMRKKGDTI